MKISSSSTRARRLGAVAALGVVGALLVAPARASTTPPAVKHVFVVNDDADIRSNEAVLWTMATCFQGDADMIVLERMQGTSLDPSAQPGGVGAKVGFDCTRKKPDFPQRNKVSAEIMKSMNPSSYL